MNVYGKAMLSMRAARWLTGQPKARSRLIAAEQVESAPALHCRRASGRMDMMDGTAKAGVATFRFRTDGALPVSGRFAPRLRMILSAP